MKQTKKKQALKLLIKQLYDLLINVLIDWLLKNVCYICKNGYSFPLSGPVWYVILSVST